MFVYKVQMDAIINQAFEIAIMVESKKVENAIIDPSEKIKLNQIATEN